MVEKKITADDVVRRVRRLMTEDRTPPVLVGSVASAPNRGVGFRNPMTSVGDLMRGGSSGAAARLGIGTTGQVLTVVAGSPAWATGGGYSDEQARDALAAALVAGANVSIVINDAADTITISAIDTDTNTTDPEVVRDTMATALVAGTGLTITVNDAADTITLALLRRYAANVVIDGGGSVITAGIKGDVVIETAGTIESWTLLADQSGSIQVDLWKDTYTNYPPVVGDAITGSSKPIISSALKAQSSTLTGWTTSVAAGDIIRVNVDSASVVTRCTLELKIREG